MALRTGKEDGKSMCDEFYGGEKEVVSTGVADPESSEDKGAFCPQFLHTPEASARIRGCSCPASSAEFGHHAVI